MVRRWLAALACVFIHVDSFAEAHCDGALSVAEIIARINHAWPILHRSIRIRGLIRLGIWPGRRPCRLIEDSHLLVDGRLPEIDAGSTFRIVRTSRAEGLAELRRALALGTEWSSTYVPALGAWINDTVAAGPGFVDTAGALHVLLKTVFGAIECVHTHPDIALTTLPGSTRWAPHQRLVHQGLPSAGDLETMLWLAERGGRRLGPDAPSSVVHPMGVTSYAVEWRRSADGEVRRPPVPSLKYSNFVSGHYPGRPERGLRQLLERGVAESHLARPGSSRVLLTFEPWSVE